MGARDEINQPKTQLQGFGFGFNERAFNVHGHVTAILSEGSNERKVLDRKNIYTLDGGVLAAMLFSGISRAPTMLGVGIGASGSASSPDSPDANQRKLNSELERKIFASVVFRDSAGAISAVPTNVVDFTTVFEGNEAVGPLNEMGILATYDASESVTTPLTDTFPNRDTTTDLNDYDILVNYLPFPVINKPSGSTLAITWRLTF